MTVEAELHGVRIDTFLARHLRNYTSWRMQRLVRAGQVTVDWAAAAEDRRVFTNETVRVTLLEPPDKLLRPEPIDVRVIYEDPWLLVVDKPAGLVAHPTGEFQTGTLANAMQHHLDRTSLRTGLLRPGVVHRLDRQTSGLMVIASSHLSHRRLSIAFETGRVSKSYIALVEGCVRERRGVLDWPIGRAKTGRHVLMSARADAIDARPARTQYEVLEWFAGHSLVRARPATGRKHQIRVHFAPLGPPQVGDEFYLSHGRFKPFHPPLRAKGAASSSGGDRLLGEFPADADSVGHVLPSGPGDDHSSGEEDEPASARGKSTSDAGSDNGVDCAEVDTGLPIRRHALHAERLAFAHPITDVWMEFQSGWPDDFETTVATLRERSTPIRPVRE